MTITLSAEAASLARRRHPWVDGGGIVRRRGASSVGDPVRLIDADGMFLAWGVWSGDPRFPVRLVSWSPEDTLDPPYFRELAIRAAKRRLALPLASHADAYRVVFGEADGLPGLVADRYADYLVVALESRALRRYTAAVAEGACTTLGLRGALLRDGDSGTVVYGEAPPDQVTVREGGLEFVVEPRRGQKTGWFCDQRDNRVRVAAYARGRRVLDAFSYSGAFAVACLAAGASLATLVDTSEDALAVAQRNLASNAVGERAELIRGDAFDALRGFAQSGRRFGLVVLDPPNLLPTGADRSKGERAYRVLQELGAAVLEPGGILATFSCSGAMDRAIFDRIVLDATAKRSGRVLERLCQPADHPVLASFRKSEYLKGLLVQVE